MEEVIRLKEIIKRIDLQNRSLLQSIDELNRQVSQLKESERRLLEDNEILTEELAEHRDLSLCKDVEHNKEQKKLKVAINNMETKMTECAQAEKREKKWIRENKALTERVDEIQKMLYSRQKAWDKKEAELIEKYERKIKEVRSDLDEKLYRMKEKMKNLFKEASTKTKEKHDQEIEELLNKNKALLERADNHDHSLTREMHKINQQNMQLHRENEFLRNRLRLMEGGKRESRLSAPVFSSTLLMEDEVGEEFSQMHLGNPRSSTPSSSASREPYRLNEVPHRNTLAPFRNTLIPHYLRSSTYETPQTHNFMKQDVKPKSSKRRTT